MKKGRFNIRASDGTDINVRCWDPCSDRRGLVCLVHGLGEHSGRYEHVAQVLAGAGFVLAAMDLRGHGKSGGKRVHADGYGQLMDDISLFLDKTRSRYPAGPLFLYGHSFGGQLVLNHMIRRKPSVKAVITTSPWLRLSRPPGKPTLLLARLMGFLRPTFTVKNVVDVEGLSRDRRTVREYVEDPLVRNQCTARLFLEAYRSGLEAIESAGEFRGKLLLMHGSADIITSPDASREFADGCGGKVTMKMWKGLYHETHNEPEGVKVIRYMRDWMEGLL